ncbi:hypothetical protein A0Z27_07215 [Campylobacter lari]|uniref:Uncharacterized protein n=1 Tax=Campylobacter lari NCTC 11845 TaxID=1388749 RepID=A0A0A8HV91_CAMLA|nr:hypothetical protein UPTC3659_0528 [Campylobacter lari NCTC 11845]EAK0848336.1 hypothetical protein [Campylobacter lari]EAK0980230.1 hypothetical protein [Campylobacter lari]EAK9955101.1 hypothetical protein [Campylobacter lari]
MFIFFRIGKYIDNITTCFNFLFNFHLIILAFFLLIFLNACGYKDTPFYEIKDNNGSIKEIKKFQSLESEI